MPQDITHSLKISKSVVLSIITITNVFVWFTYATTILMDKMSISLLGFHEELTVYTIGIFGAIFSILAGAYLITIHITRKNFFIIWIMIGIFTSFLFIILESTTMLNMLILAFGVNFSFCLGIPASLAFFAESTLEENRGRFAALALLIMFFMAYILNFTRSKNAVIDSLVLICWRSLGLIGFLPSENSFTQSNEKINPPLISIIKERSFALYIIPWTMFSMVNYLGWPLVAKFHGENFADFCAAVGNIVAAAFSIVAGYASDKIGRKRTLITGFIIFGLGYAIVGIYPFSNLAWYFYIVVDGVAWGVIWVIFWFVIWGDLAHGRRSEKYYALGFLPYLFSSFLRVTLGKIITYVLSEYAIFSLAAFFLFLAVIPLMFAPETLPEKTIRERELRAYIEKAKRVREKFTKG